MNKYTVMGNDFGEEDLRFLYRQMKLNRMRERNRKRSSALVIFGLVAVLLAIALAGVRG